MCGQATFMIFNPTAGEKGSLERIFLSHLVPKLTELSRFVPVFSYFVPVFSYFVPVLTRLFLLCPMLSRSLHVHNVDNVFVTHDEQYCR